MKKRSVLIEIDGRWSKDENKKKKRGRELKFEVKEQFTLL
jgi:hypothetical protein